MAGTARNMTPGDWGLLLLLALLWGGSFFFIELALRGFAPLTLVAVRLTLASVVLWIALRASGGRLPRDGRTWRALLVMALLNGAIPLSLFANAQTVLPSGLASILNALVPIIGVVIAHFLTHDEKASPGRVAGVVLGFTGVAAMIGIDALKGLGANIVPQLACLLAAVCYSFASVYGRRFQHMGLSPLATATGQIALAALVLLPVAAAVDRPWNAPMPGATAWFAMAILALVSTALGFVLFYRLLASAGATNSMLVTFLVPVTAIVLGALALGERLAPQHFLGIGLVWCGLAAIDGRLPRLLWRGLRKPSASL